MLVRIHSNCVCNVQMLPVHGAIISFFLFLKYLYRTKGKRKKLLPCSVSLSLQQTREEEFLKLARAAEAISRLVLLPFYYIHSILLLFFFFSNPLLSKRKINPQLCVCVCTDVLFCFVCFRWGRKKKGMKCDGSQMRKSLQSSLSPTLFFLPHWRHFVLFSFFPSARFKLAFTMTSSRRTSACVNSIRTFPSLSIPFKKIKSYKYIEIIPLYLFIYLSIGWFVIPPPCSHRRISITILSLFLLLLFI